ETHNALGVVLRTAKNFAGAQSAYQVAVKADPRNARAHNNLGELLAQTGDHAGAVAAYERAIAADPAFRQAYRNLAMSLVSLARPDDAARVLVRALQSTPNDAALLLDLAQLEHDRDRFPQAIELYGRYLALAPDDADARVNYASALLDAGRFPQALTEFERVRASHPERLDAQHGVHETLSRLVPPWHVPMMNEDKRNFAYRDAIRAVVKPTDHVLEIGTGAGLLALLSAQAGAKHVTTCEMVEAVAGEAKRIVAKNGFADRVTVVPKKSTDVILGQDLPAPADVLVSEILANDFVGEGVLPSLIDAKTRLLKPGARVIPATGAMMGVLVGGEEVRYLLDLGDVCGFDMRSFARFKPWSQSVPQPLAYEALSDDVALVSYDFNDIETLKPATGAVTMTATSSGRCYGVLQWIRIGLAPGISYENHPRDTQSVWNKVLYAFPAPVDVEAGKRVLVQLWHSGSHFYLTGGKVQE
ncbi:MAG: tetratricopeptide repeat protein, partial [Rhodospirillaceae bacterium]|nr:tetratricopeptide repeat protein [Rhodospirillaceae bacterium]